MDEREKAEQALNELIKECRDKGGFVWIVDKRHNNFAIRLTEEVRISSYVPTKTKEGTEGETD